jgi:hypothetical protein
LGYILALLESAKILINFLPEEKTSRIGVYGLVLGLLIYLAYIGTCPPTARDALTHHLAIPKLWNEHGYIFSTPWHGWSSYPMIVQIAFSFILRHLPDSSCAIYHGGYLVILAACTAQLGERISSGIGGLAASLVFLNPNLCRLATIPLVEIPLCIFAVIGLSYATWLVTAPDQHAPNSGLYRTHIIFFGLSIGLLASCKPNGGMFGGMLWAVTLVFLLKKNLCFWSAALRPMIIMGIVASVVYAPWAIKARSEQGSFFYPFVKGVDHYPTRPGTSSTHPLIRRTLLYDETIFDVATLPIRMFLVGEDDNPSHFDGVLAPLLILGVCPLASCFRSTKTNLAQTTILLFLGVSLAGEVARVRYLAPLFGPLAAITAFHLSKSTKSLRRTAYGSSLVVTGLYLSAYQVGRGQYEYLTGAISRDQYLTKNIPEYRMIQYLNDSIPEKARVYLLLTSNPFYYCRENVFSPGHYSDKALVSWLQSSHSDDEFERAVAGAGITHFAGSYRRTPESLRAQLTPDEFTLWDRFASKHLILRYQDEQFGIWEIASNDPRPSN